jgi:LysR family transcriptional regulator, glycine cleavage system transcriptional activator
LSQANSLPPLRAMLVFDAVARCGSITGAARELNVSIGAVSQQLKILEETVGVPLIERSGRSVKLTAFGHHYLPNIAAGFESLRSAQKALQRSRQSDNVVISAPASISIRWLANRLFEWSSERADVRLRLQTGDPEPDLQKGEADFRVTYADHVLCHAHFAELFTDAVTPALSPRLLKGRTLTQPTQILDFPLIGVDWGPDIDAPPGDWPHWFASNDVAGFAARPAFTFSLSSAAIDAAVAGNGVVLAQLSMIDDDLREGRLVCPFPDRRQALAKPYYLAWGAASLTKPAGRALQRWLVNTSRSRLFITK